jgi:hypothetical protein
LGDVARHIRAEKGNTSAPAAINTNPAKASAAASPANAQAPAAIVTADKQAPAIGQFGPYATKEEFNLHFLDRYEEGIRVLFEQEKFETLDQIASTARSTRSRLPGGFWTLHIIYSPLTDPAAGTYEAKEQEWTAHLARLQRWVTQRPDSITARVALGESQLMYAWRARGGGYAGGVSADAWKIFGDRAELAAKTLMDASTLPTKCPEWYLSLQLVARALGQSKEMQAAIFEKSIAFEPDYQYFYRAQAELLLPRWEGEEGEMAVFAKNIADRVGGKKGDMIYYQIATYLNCACDSDSNLNGLEWPRIKRGYIALEGQYGESIDNLNTMAYMAGAGGDPIYAEELFGRIGEGWDQKIWHKKENFLMVRDWAKGSTAQKAAEDAIKGALAAAEQNLQTAEGRSFDEKVSKTFAADYGAVIADCLKSSGDSWLVPFDMAAQVTKNGAVEKVFVSVSTGTSACLSAKVEKGLFPAPPKPDYWIKISLQARR